MGRATQGVKVIKLGDKDGIADIAVIPTDDSVDDEILLDEEGNPIENVSDEAGNEVGVNPEAKSSEEEE